MPTSCQRPRTIARQGSSATTRFGQLSTSTLPTIIALPSSCQPFSRSPRNMRGQEDGGRRADGAADGGALRADAPHAFGLQQPGDEHAKDPQDDEQHPVVGLQRAQLVERAKHGEVQRQHQRGGAHANGGEARAAELVRVALADQEVDSRGERGDEHERCAEQVLPELGEVDAAHGEEDADVGDDQGRDHAGLRGAAFAAPNR